MVGPLLRLVYASSPSGPRAPPTNDGAFGTCSPLLVGVGVKRMGDSQEFTSSSCRMATEERLDDASMDEEPVAASGVRVAKSGLSPDSRWITDPWDRGVLFSVKVDQIMHDVRSKFQRVQVMGCFCFRQGWQAVS